MNFITKTLNKLFKSSNQLELNKIKPIVVKINDLEKNFSNFKGENFVEKTHQFKKNVLEGRGLDEILPEAFMPALSPSIHIVGSLKICQHFKIWFSLKAVPRGATVFIKPILCIEITSV